MRRWLSAFIVLVLVLGSLAGFGAIAETAELPPEEGTKQVRFFWSADNVDYEKCDMWIWMPGKDGRGYLFTPCEYGVTVQLNVPDDTEEVGFIVRKNCSEPGGTSWGTAAKDYDGDRFARLEGPVTEIYLKSGDGAQYKSSDGGKTLYQEKKFTMAGITAFDEIQYFIEPAAKIESLADVRVYEDGRQISVTALSSLNNKVVTGRISLGEKLDLSKKYTVEIEGYGQKIAMPTGVFDTQEFIDELTYDGNDLGATITGDKTVFKLWAPTASEVKVNLYDWGYDPTEDSWGYTEEFETIDMVRGEKGVWSAEAPVGHGKYYTYSVTTAEGTKEAVDPYARAVGPNGDRGMVVDLSLTDPEGFDFDSFYGGIDAYNEAIIWEVHVRDFSNKIAESKYPGKYLAFTETGLKNAYGESAGIDYLKDLGITHVHLQPIYDFATVDEMCEDGGKQFNWGYDPKNYNAPEGSYATNQDGETRITELKQMVMAMHENGMGVIMDVVYNHTYSLDSCLNRCVPYYYYRFNSNGEPSNGSGCGNETASERTMMRKYIVDSVKYWQRQYHIDGFRFDLMALHDTETMQQVEQALHAMNPKAIIYGEGWTGGTTPLNPNLQANQANIRNITASEGAIGAVAVFNDATRDGLKGSVFDSLEKGYISGNINTYNAQRVIFGITGGVRGPGASWSVDDSGIINYMSCHDNNTLWDKLLLSNGGDSEDTRIKMNRLGAAIIMLGKGTPFFLAGEEMMRTKQGDSNSYNSGDEINNIDWDALFPDSAVTEMRDYYRELIRLRKENDFITKADVECSVIIANGIEVIWSVDGETVAVAAINPGSGRINYNFPAGDWDVLMMDGRFYGEGEKTLRGNAPIGGRSIMLAKKAG